MTWNHFEFLFVAAIGSAAAELAEGGGGDECMPSTSKGTPSKSMTCRKTGADKMLNFMKTFVSITCLHTVLVCEHV